MLSRSLQEGIVFIVDCSLKIWGAFESASSLECHDSVTDSFFRVIASIVFLVLCDHFLDDVCEILSLVVVHLEEHLLALATVWLVVVDEQVTQNPLIKLEPGLEAAAQLASASSATFSVISLRLLLVRVEALAVLTQKSL